MTRLFFIAALLVMSFPTYAGKAEINATMTTIESVSVDDTDKTLKCTCEVVIE